MFTTQLLPFGLHIVKEMFESCGDKASGVLWLNVFTIDHVGSYILKYATMLNAPCQVGLLS